MKHDKETPLHIQCMQLANKQKMKKQDFDEWLHLIKTAYILGGDNMFENIEIPKQTEKRVEGIIKKLDKNDTKRKSISVNRKI